MAIDTARVEIERVFQVLRRRGLNPTSAFALASEMGLDDLAALRAVRSVFNLELAAAKEAALRATGTAASLQDYQRKLVEGLEAIEPELDALLDTHP